MTRLSLILFSLCTVYSTMGQHSVARQWNEVILEGIRNDLARPTVHARNLFHLSAAMYDAWAIYDEKASPYFLGNHCALFEITAPSNKTGAVEETLSYALFRLINHRFKNSPGSQHTLLLAQDLMEELGYDTDYSSEEYWNGAPAALGNYLASCIISYGLNDGANEQNDYANEYYEPVNEPLFIQQSGNPTITNPDRWQPLTLDFFIDQSGNPSDDTTPAFLSPEWGNVKPFALQKADATIKHRDGHEYIVYHDPGPPPSIDSDAYKWGFCLVNTWSSHLDPSDEVMWDISPKSIGNIQSYPNSIDDYESFYDLEQGGDASEGWSINPITGMPYEEQFVPRGDYTRVLAEFWADGPDSETPPGHWFTILNYVNDHPQLVKRIGGTGEDVDALEWDVKTYFTLGGAMHDVAVSVWGIKGWYDYIRPVSAIRYMASKGQSSDPSLPGFHEEGMPLIDGFVEVITSADDPLAVDEKDVGKIKIKAWKGPLFIINPETDAAGVDWILAEDWWPYQRPSFVTPPFAGYVSGHSTFSRAASIVLEELTGSAFFPGGMGEFVAPKNEFLVFEEGPSVDVVLQWATYRDAADQCSLSRIWGGIHPPADDIPGREIGNIIGEQSVAHAMEFFNGTNDIMAENPTVITYPNPSSKLLFIQSTNSEQFSFEIYDIHAKIVFRQSKETNQLIVNIESLNKGMYLIKAHTSSKTITTRFIKN
ncbi:T9SS type A sorting domain-containing protein [Ekhidna sp. MALMAid0563]|uniref:T9SS type A sorting domain-containing protein n=1 Tax=Ekhidna sp. MALMAid0563 TaxID=3143937 RepID=UPI0032DFC95F